MGVARGRRWGHHLTCACLGWGPGGRGHRAIPPPGWEVRAVRSPGSVVTEGPWDLGATSCLPEASPSLTLLLSQGSWGTGQECSQRALWTGVLWKPALLFSWPWESSHAVCLWMSRLWPGLGKLTSVCPVVVPATGSMCRDISKTRSPARFPAGLCHVHLHTASAPDLLLARHVACGRRVPSMKHSL